MALEKTITVAEGLGNADASQVIEGATFTSEEGFNQQGKFSPIAANIAYDNTESGLDANTSQEAIDETRFRYVPDSDVFQMRDADNVWHNWASGGLQSFDLNDLTKLSPEDWEIEYANNASDAEITSNPFKFSMTGVSDTGKSNVTATTTKTFYLGSFNRFVMSGKIKGYLNQGSIANDYYHKIAFVNTVTGNEDYVWSDIASYGTDTEISESAVISLDPTAPYKIRLRVFGYKGWIPSYFQFDDFRLYKEV